MNNTENELAPLQNVQIGLPASKQPEQEAQKERHVLRPIGFTNLIYQWQPMGIRITVQIPFIGDDATYICLIRNTPFIPLWTMNVLNGGQSRDVYLYNNCRNVYLGLADKNDSSIQIWPYPEGFQNSMIHYDYPPPLATLANCFRKWRGGLQYRFRQVANFATQGYPFATVLKNVAMPIGIYNEYTETPVINDLDFSYRESMLNAYVPSDTGMFRHLEVSVPWEYPVPYYDHYNWLEQRVAGNFKKGAAGTWIYDDKRHIIEPHADNWICIGLRGTIDSTKQTTSIIQFELEYRAMEGFQFADPGLPTNVLSYGKGEKTMPTGANPSGNGSLQNKTIPTKGVQSDGVSVITGIRYESEADKLQAILDDRPFNHQEGDGVQLGPDQGNKRIETVPDPTTDKPNVGFYSECSVDTRTGQTYTYCKQSSNGEWKTFKGNKVDRFTQQGLYYPTRQTRELKDTEIEEAHRNSRYDDRQF